MTIFAEVICAVPLIIGLITRLACLPILFSLLVALLAVQLEWTIDKAQFGSLFIFASIVIAGPGHFALGRRLEGMLRYV